MRISFNTTDGQELGGTWFDCAEPRAVAVLAGGTGIPHPFYGRFARFLAQHGIATLTFDYRGVGASRPAKMAGFQATMADWGRLDVPAAHREARRRLPGLPLVHLGHSVGGQLLGLLPEPDQVTRGLFFNVSTGWLGGMGTAMRATAWLFFNAVTPIGSTLLGYVPARALGLGEDLPEGVARQWARWCRNVGYLRMDLRGDLKDAHYEDVRFPILAVNTTDDPIATPENVASMMALYSAAPVVERWVTPAELGVPKVGHLGLLRPNGAPLWEQWVNDILGSDSPTSAGWLPTATAL